MPPGTAGRTVRVRQSPGNEIRKQGNGKGRPAKTAPFRKTVPPRDTKKGASLREPFFNVLFPFGNQPSVVVHKEGLALFRG